MRYNNIGDAIAAMIDQQKRGLTDHEYELHLKRLKRYYNIVEECADALEVCSDEVGSERYMRWHNKFVKYTNKLEAERNLGL